MKRLHSPTMEESELPTSPRKKLKLQESSFGPTMADNATEAPTLPEVMTDIPHHKLSATNNHPSEQSTLNSADLPISSKESTTLESLKAGQISETPLAMPGFKVEDSHGHSNGLSDLLSKQVVHASEAQIATTDVADIVNDVYSKEAACGITEFVSPDLMGFSGILKKRYVFSMVTLKPISYAQIHRLPS